MITAWRWYISKPENPLRDYWISESLAKLQDTNHTQQSTVFVYSNNTMADKKKIVRLVSFKISTTI